MPGQLDQIRGMLGGQSGPPPAGLGQSWRSGPDYSGIKPGNQLQNAPSIPSFWEWAKAMGFGSNQILPDRSGSIWKQPPPEQMEQLIATYNEYVQGLQGQIQGQQQQYDWETNERNRKKNEIFSQFVNPYGPPQGYSPWGRGGR